MRKRLKYWAPYRVFAIVWMSVRFLLQIFWFQRIHRIWDQETKRKWERLLGKQGREYRKRSIQLGGLLIKFGQFLSTRADLLPPTLLNELQDLTDNVEAVPFKYSRKVIEKEWKGKLESRLRSIDEQAVASASIGEVYKAFLMDGTPVAVKVQRYRVNEIFHMDFRALRIVFWMLSKFTVIRKKSDLPALYREVVAVISNELDFTQELENANYFRNRFADFPDVYIPEYYDEYSTRRLLVMEWIDGASVTDVAFMERHQISREKTAQVIFNLYAEQFLYAGTFHSDPHPGNIMLKSDGTLVLIDFGMAGEIRKQDADYIRMIIQGIVLNDYNRAIKGMQEMNFLLENANTERVKKVMKEMINRYLHGDFKNMNGDTMQQIFQDIHQFVNEQPIQLPANYAFLGRAASIVTGVLMTVYPEIDLMKWGKPVIKKWVIGENTKYTFYKDVLAETTRPLLSLPRAMVSFLESPERDRAWDVEKHQSRLFHQYYILYAVLFFFIALAGIAVTLYGYHIQLALLYQVGFTVGGLGAVGWLLMCFKHYALIKTLQLKRRGNK